MNNDSITANGKPVAAALPCTLEQFLVAQKLLPRSVVVEHNGEAVAPSEFAQRQLKVQVFLGGRVRMCDVAKTLSNDNPDGCPAS